MEDKDLGREGNLDEDQYVVNQLIDEITSSPFPEQVSPIVRAKLSIELAKDAVTNGELEPAQVADFANSLIKHNLVPVIVGTPDCKIFPIKAIVGARQLVVANMRKAALAGGLDFDEGCRVRQKKVEELISHAEGKFNTLGHKYGPFTLSPQQAVEELVGEAKRVVAAKQVLGELPPTEAEQEAVDGFLRTSFPNVFLGHQLLDWLSQHYGTKNTPFRNGVQ